MFSFMRLVDIKETSNADIMLQVKDNLLVEPGLQLVLVYGSVVAGTLRTDSDVDIAVLFDRPLTFDQKMMLAMKLEKELHRTVDFVDLFNLNGTILKQILCKGKVLIQKDNGSLFGLIHKMIYNQADMMPYVIRTLKERQQRFTNG